ncbi:MAG: metalloregulator ArsR/SmtB family transcription factor [Sulfitobacter sp.]
MTNIEQMGFRALADPTRREILILLSRKDMTIAEVADNFEMTRAAVKKHLSILSQGDLITVRRNGRTCVNALQTQGLKRVFDWFGFFDDFWDDRLSTLKDTIEKDTQ